MEINKERLWERQHQIGKIGADPKGGISRFPWTKEYKEAVGLLKVWMESIGMKVRNDTVGNLFGSKYRYEGEGYGVSVSFGKAYQLSKSWNFEWEIGAGAVWLDYDKYWCKRCGDLVNSKHVWSFLPTRAALNFVYLF